MFKCEIKPSLIFNFSKLKYQIDYTSIFNCITIKENT
nr:MAG TPA: hypothetical protein [Caudoviricetes sp.]